MRTFFFDSRDHSLSKTLSMGVKGEGYRQDGWEMAGGTDPNPTASRNQGLFQQNLPERDLTTPLSSPPAPRCSSGFKRLGQIPATKRNRPG